MKARVDQNTCTGCGMCAEICPEVFKMAGEKAEVYTNPVPENATDTCKQAAEGCPVDAISIGE